MKKVKIKKQWFKYSLKFSLFKQFKTTHSEGGSGNQVETLYSSHPDSSLQKVCLFAHFDSDSEVSEETMNYLKEIKNKGGYKLAFCTTSKNLNGVEIEKLKAVCFLVLKRSNVGLDFGSWHTLWDQVQMMGINPSQILFANDSVSGPFVDLKPIFMESESSECDFLGLTDSFEHSHHLQSYFLIFKQRALQSYFFRDFVKNFKYDYSRSMIIWKYEIGFSQSLLKEGLQGESLFSVGILGKGKKRFNPTMDMGHDLVKQLGFPFLKKKLHCKE